MRHSILLSVGLTAMLGAAALGGCGSDTGTGGGGGSAPAGAVNACESAKAEDHTADAEVHIMSTASNTYSPACIRIKAGSKVTWDSDFTTHPLAGGEVVDGDFKPDASSPIKETKTGTTVSFTFADKGTFGYYCEVHGTLGMAGAVFVE